MLVTGGTAGTGLAIAKACAQTAGYVFLTYRRDDEAALQAAREVSDAGGRVHLIKADAGAPDGCRTIAAAIGRTTAFLDQVVHCGEDPYAAPALEADPYRFAQAVTANGTSLLFLVQAVRFLLARGSSIVFMGGREGRAAVPGHAALGSATGLAASLVRHLAVELEPMGVRINAIAPSVPGSETSHTVLGYRATPPPADAAVAVTGREADDADYARLIKWLATPEAEAVRGQVIFVEGRGRPA